MDALIVPITAAPYEIMITAQLVHKGVIKGWPMYLVPNNLPPIRSRREAMLTTLAGMGIEVAPTAIVRRVTHWDAELNGLGVCEYAPASQAADEIQEYWDWLSDRLRVDGRYVKRKRTKTLGTGGAGRWYMPDPKKGLDTLLDDTEVENRTRKLGESPAEPVLVTDDEGVDEQALRSQLGELGFELRRKRARRGVFAKNDGVEGKTKLTVHLPDDLRRDVKWASVTLDIAESDNRPGSL